MSCRRECYVGRGRSGSTEEGTPAHDDDDVMMLLMMMMMMIMMMMIIHL